MSMVKFRVGMRSGQQGRSRYCCATDLCPAQSTTRSSSSECSCHFSASLILGRCKKSRSFHGTALVPFVCLPQFVYHAFMLDQVAIRHALLSKTVLVAQAEMIMRFTMSKATKASCRPPALALAHTAPGTASWNANGA